MSPAAITMAPDIPLDQGTVLMAVQANADVRLEFPAATAPSWKVVKHPASWRWAPRR